ncbi:MAG: hypothetical protein ACRCVU_14005 [Flavobacterium sp.]
MKPKIDESLLQECTKLPMWTATTGAEVVVEAKNWRIMYNDCYRKHNALIKTIRVYNGR